MRVMAKRGQIELSGRINALPDELLLCILSFLSLKEAVATSILCHRWRYLWTLTNKLNFDGLDFYRKLCSDKKDRRCVGLGEVWFGSRCEEEIWNYVAWVNNVLKLHKGSSIDEFGIDFYLSEAHKVHIEEWLRFASARKVQSLELKLRRGPYSLPKELLISFEHLRRMCTEWVQITGEDIELLLCTCPLLEVLSVSISFRITALKIINPSPALKRLEINCCSNLMSVEIRDASLMCFVYQGKKLQQFVLNNVPHLVEMHTGGEIAKSMKDFHLMLSSCLPQLEKLTIDQPSKKFFEEKEAIMLYNTVKMSNLKQLVVKVSEDRLYRCKIMSLSYLIAASPLLQSFVLEAYGGDYNEWVVEQSSYFVNELPEKIEVVGPYRYPRLKRVEMVGYRGTSPELDIIAHLLDNAAALEEVIIDLRKRDHPWRFQNILMPKSATGLLQVGYPCGNEDQIIALKASVKAQFAKRLPPALHLHLSVL